MDWEQPNDLSRKGRESESQNGAYRQSYKHKSTLLHNFNQAERECRERLQKRREDRAHAETKPESYSTSHTEERSYHVQVKPDPELLAHPSSTSHMSTFTAEPAKALPSQSIPIFALNSNGSYYVPMSVDISVIHPYMNLYKEETCPILHPVTISVNFQPAHIERSASKPNLGVIHQQQSVIKHWRDQPCLWKSSSISVQSNPGKFSNLGHWSQLYTGLVKHSIHHFCWSKIKPFSKVEKSVYIQEMSGVLGWFISMIQRG